MNNLPNILKEPKQIAVLFVEENGVYYEVPELDLWPESRDARQYDGPLPVIAHPPCQRWGALAYVNYYRWGGAHNKPKEDGGCFASALDAVNKYGGVLEHPANTKAWKTFGLAKPIKGRWVQSGKGWTCLVWQSAYGHQANKATWLYYVGVQPPFAFNWDQPRGTHQIGGAARGQINKPTLAKAAASKTPEAFRDELIKLALWSFNKP